MRKKRVLVLMHIDLVPPDDVSGKPDEEVFEYKTEYDVINGLRDLGHEVHKLGLYDDLTPLRQAIQACRKGGTVSIPGVYGGLLDKIPFGAAFAKALTFRMGQTHVHRYMRPQLEQI